jgi:hypothetical protein
MGLIPEKNKGSIVLPIMSLKENRQTGAEFSIKTCSVDSRFYTWITMVKVSRGNKLPDQIAISQQSCGFSPF